MGTNDKGTACDFLFALDDTGSVWTFWYDGSGSISYNFYSSTLTGLDYPTESGAQNSSLVLSEDGSTLFFSYFTGTTNEIYVTADAEQQSGVLFPGPLRGDMGDGVWPAALYEALRQWCGKWHSSSVPLHTEAHCNAPGGNACPGAEHGCGYATRLPGYCGAPVQALGFHRQQDGYPGADRKRCPGVDTGSTNGLLTVEYDGEIMTLTDVQVAASYCSIAQAEGL